ncbi:MAG: IPTL-CTERM sorting domain-containing protein [Acidobacteriia bacterium]|nr:IPTL-CTERM sorting domain-containing protein [Terriglobia bacterium]
MKSRNRFDGAHRGRTRAIWLGLAVCTVLGATSVLAAPYTYVFHYRLISGQGTATGSVTFDDSLLAPNTNPGTTCDLSLLYSLDLHMTGLPSSPSSTSFTKADLLEWRVQTDSNGRLVDINFFMQAACSSPTKVNTDGYGIEGVEPFKLEVFELDGAINLPTFQDQGPGIPALSTYGVAALALLVLIAGALLVARRLS